MSAEKLGRSPCVICESAAKVCEAAAKKNSDWIARNHNAPDETINQLDAALREAEACADLIRSVCSHALAAPPAPSALAEELEALAKAATPGPWGCDRPRVGWRIRSLADETLGHYVLEYRQGPPVRAGEDAELIVALVNALPELLDALRREPR